MTLYTNPVTPTRVPFPCYSWSSFYCFYYGPCCILATGIAGVITLVEV